MLHCLCVLQDGRAPDVWLQLLECCCSDPDAHNASTRSIVQQLAHQAGSQQRLAVLEQCISAQQQQLAAQQQVVSQQQGEIVDLRGQIAAQAQMMQLLQSLVQQLLHCQHPFARQ